MIKNERQSKITRSRADEMRNALGELRRAPLPDGLQPEMRELQLDALRGTLGDLQAELAEYDALHDATVINATGIEQLPTSLIQARIACGLHPTSARRADRRAGAGDPTVRSDRLLRRQLRSPRENRQRARNLRRLRDPPRPKLSDLRTIV